MRCVRLTWGWQQARRRRVAAVVAVAAAFVSGVLAPGVAAARGAHDRAASGPDSLSAVRQAVLAGSLSRQHRLLDGCTAVGGGRTYHLGCNHSLVASAADPARPLVTGQPAGLGATDLARAFHLTGAGDRSGTVGIVDFGATPTLASDLAAYRKAYGLPACTTASGCLRIVGRDGGPPPKPVGLPAINTIEQGLAFETALDVQMASAACPRCRIVLVEMPLNLPAMALQYLGEPRPLATALADGTDTAIKLGANAVSMSYVLGNGQHPEIATGPLAQRMHHPGVAILASAGDRGYVKRDTANQTWPQELPGVISAGGVELTSPDGGKSFATRAWGKVEADKTWWAAASDCSTLLGPANGQPANVTALCDGHRADTDVSAASTNLAIYDTYFPADKFPGGWVMALGTSASAPYLAGLYARAGTAGVDGPNLLYHAPSGTIDDVTTGSNTRNGAAGCSDSPPALCVSGKGWDGPTGLGVPHGLGAFQPGA